MTEPVQKQKRAAKRKAALTQLPTITCPHCAAKAFATKMILSCEHCSTTYPINFADLADYVEFNTADTDQMRVILGNLYQKMQQAESSAQKNTDKTERSNSLKQYHAVFSGKGLELLKRLRADMGYETLQETLAFMLSAVVCLIAELKHIDGKEVYLADNQGNRSDDIKPKILKGQQDIFHSKVNTEAVESLLASMNIRMAVDDMKAKDADNGED